MRYLGWILLFFITSSFAFADALLQQYCERAGGEIVKGLKCPKNKIHWKSDTCIVKDRSDKTLFFNGCSGPSGGHAELFYPGCVKHDYCYHHEPATQGLKKSDCDKNLLNDLLHACEEARDRAYCRFWAKTMYEGVKIGGAIAFNCANYQADYNLELNDFILK